MKDNIFRWFAVALVLLLTGLLFNQVYDTRTAVKGWELALADAETSQAQTRVAQANSVRALAQTDKAIATITEAQKIIDQQAAELRVLRSRLKTSD